VNLLTSRLPASCSKSVGRQRKSSAADSRQSGRRHCQAVGADRAQRPATGYVGNACERAEVPRRVCVQDFVGQDGNLELDSLRDAQPMKAGQRVRDVRYWK